ARTPDNLLIGTWNLRGFADLSPRWQAGPRDSPKRDWHAIACIASIIEHFDVAAIQETRRNTTALRALLDQLGPQWRVISSDVTEGGPGNGERLAFLYDTDRVEPSGLVGEIVLPPGTDSAQFARTPYLAGFSRSGVEFVLVTVHIVWGSQSASRVAEVAEFARWMRTWSDRHDEWNANLLVLGDFNLDRVGDPLYEAFLSTGLWPPAALNEVPRTVFDNDKEHHFYDQIAWFASPTGDSRLDGLTYTGHAGGIDFTPLVFTDLSRTDLSWRISDHFPLWTEFHVDASEPPAGGEHPVRIPTPRDGTAS
ncbi:MAG TPA: endonuclease/exonuclease/phosphatase family protein, partial [Solirubrobacterales bacterium]|nr:endonuclease/exonuclease/phosphatase family protein [Solirubrobacterales bacterium]